MSPSFASTAVSLRAIAPSVASFSAATASVTKASHDPGSYAAAPLYATHILPVHAHDASLLHFFFFLSWHGCQTRAVQSRPTQPLSHTHERPTQRPCTPPPQLVGHEPAACAAPARASATRRYFE